MTRKRKPGIKALLISSTLAAAPAATAQDIVISEFMASNSSTAVAGQPAGQFHDWIEIQNRSTGSVNLVGWHLTDDEGVPFKWTFPNTTIPAGGYKIVFASGNNTPTNGVNHTNFALASGGGHLALVRPDLSVASSYDYLDQFSDISYGFLDSSGNRSHLSSATPGSSNVDTEYLYVRDPAFSHQRGHYSAPFSVTLSTTTPSATIRYTTDGSEPAATGNGSTYASPIGITTTTVLRVRAFRSGYASSNIDTQTYIFPEAVTTQTAPPGYPTNWQDDGAANYDMDTEISRSALYHDRLIEGLSDLPTLSVSTDAKFSAPPASTRTPSATVSKLPSPPNTSLPTAPQTAQISRTDSRSTAA